MKKISLFAMLGSLLAVAQAQNLYFPPLNGNTWETVSPASLGWCEDKIDILHNYLEQKNTKAFIVLKDGKIAIERYYGTFTQDSLWYWASAGKTLTSFTVGIAKQEGHLSLSDLTSQYLGTGWTVCPPAKEDLITIRHQLTMTSGLDDGVPDHYCTIDTCLQYKADAGTRWAYHNGPYTLLDGVIENATGQNLNLYFTQKVKNPTGITGAFVQMGFNNVFVSKARSMARFGLLMQNRGNWNGTQVMTDTAYYNQMITPSQTLNKSYGYLWWLNGKASYRVPGYQINIPGPLNPSAPPDMYAALGKNGQILNIVPSQGLVYVRMGDAPGVGEVPFLFNDTIWQKLNDVLCTSSLENSALQMQELKAWPNPAVDYCTFQIPLAGSVISMSDMSGRTLFSEKRAAAGDYTLTLGAYPAGMYTLRCQAPDGRLYGTRLIISSK